MSINPEYALTPEQAQARLQELAHNGDPCLSWVPNAKHEDFLTQR
jgi:hypothetical protein